jgi:hypothetical protein
MHEEPSAEELRELRRQELLRQEEKRRELEEQQLARMREKRNVQEIDPRIVIP